MITTEKNKKTAIHILKQAINVIENGGRHPTTDNMDAIAIIVQVLNQCGIE